MGKYKGFDNAKVKRRIWRANTNKIIGKIVNNVAKEGHRKKMRQTLNKIQGSVNDLPQYGKIKFGSINVNGLDDETTSAVKNIIESRRFDVRYLLRREYLPKRTLRSISQQTSTILYSIKLIFTIMTCKKLKDCTI